eukprot:1402722-Amphidinium_carterae.4
MNEGPPTADCCGSRHGYRRRSSSMVKLICYLEQLGGLCEQGLPRLEVSGSATPGETQQRHSKPRVRLPAEAAAEDPADIGMVGMVFPQAPFKLGPHLRV